jgi:hypothetical protein
MPYTIKLEGIEYVREGTGGIVKRATIQIERDYLIIDGMKVTFDIIPQFMYELAHPDPRRWYRLRRVGDACMVDIKMEPEDGGPTVQ